MTGLPPEEGPLTAEELQLATRDHGMPLEALRYDVTPSGMHCLLVHFDIPDVDPSTWRLEVGGHVEAPRTLGLPELRAMPSRTLPVTVECAGNGCARLWPRPVSQPWLVEAVGTATWTGVALRDVLAPAGVRSGTVELVFTGADHGEQGGADHDYERSLPLDDATRPEVLLAYEMNGRPRLASTSSVVGPPTQPATCGRMSSRGTTRAWATTWCRPCRSPYGRDASDGGAVARSPRA